MSQAASRNPLHWVVAGAITSVVAFAGTQLTDLGPWYFNLVKPSWQPPDWAFGPGWTVIFVLATLAAVRGWREVGSASGRRLMVGLLLANGLFNMLWSLLFFKLERPDWALLEVPALWASVLALIVLLWSRSRAAAWLLVPYLAWVSFAAFLNYTVVQLNPAPHAGG